jgi:hypothetical protein
MDLSRFKKVLSGIAVAAMTLTQIAPALAYYSDVSGSAWYKESVDAMLAKGVLDSGQARFRGADQATRAEFVKMIVELNGGLDSSSTPAQPSFVDVPPTHWAYAYMEAAAEAGYLKGDKDCYGKTNCYARPNANVNRAEAASLINRSFGLEWTGEAPQFVDNPSGQWYTDAIQTAADHCVLQGDGNTGKVRPGDPMNRAEMVTMLNRVDQGLMYGVDCGDEPVSTEPMIKDVVATSTTTVEVSYNMSVDQSAAATASHYTVTSGSVEIPVTSATLINQTTVELTLGESTEAGREYTVAVSDMKTAGGDMFSDTEVFKGYTVLVLGKGTLEVSVSSKNPVGDTLPKGAQGVTMLTLDLTASCDDSVQINGITLLHEGFGDETDISGVYAAINGARISRKRTIDSQEQTAPLHFTKTLVVDPCKTVTVDFAADFTTSAVTASEHGMAVELASDFTSNAKAVTGNFPIRGNQFRVAAVTSGTVSVTYRTISPDEVEVGDKVVVIGKFEVATDSVEDQTIYSMTFEQNSTVGDGDVINVKVRRSDGTVLTNTVAQFVGDFATVVFDPPFTILEGDKVTFEVVSDITGGAGDSIIIHFEESSDLFAVGSLYGYGVNGQLYGSQVTLPTETSTLPDTVTIDAGELTIELDGPAQTSYTRDAKDAILAKAIFSTGGEPVTFRQLFVAVQGQTSTGAALETVTTGSYDNIHEVFEGFDMRNSVTGRTVSAVRLTSASADSGVCVHSCTTPASSSSSGTYQIYRFDDVTMQGRETWLFRGDFKNNGAANHPRGGDRFKVIICGEPTKILSSGSLTTNSTGCNFGGLIASSTAYQMDVEGQSTGDKVGDVRPRGNIAGNFQRISSASLNIAQKAQVATDTAVKNAAGVRLFRFEARAGEAEDVLLTKLIFDSKSGSLNNANDYQLWVDTDGDSQVETILMKGASAQNSKITFNQLTAGGFVIPKEQTVAFEVRAKIAASLTNDDLQLKFATGETNYVEAEQLADGSALSNIKTNSTCSTTPCDITVATVDGTRFSLVSQGDLFVSKDTETLRSHQCLGGALCDPILRLKFHAENEDIDVTDLQINSSGSTAASVDRLELYKEGDANPFMTATIGACGADDVLLQNPGNSAAVIVAFCAQMESQQLVVKRGQDQKVLVRPRLKADTGGATSNNVIQAFIDSQAIANNATGSGAVRARGVQSSNNLSANDADSTQEGEVFIGVTSATTNAFIVGQKNVSVLAKITSITNANNDANGSNVPTGVSDIGQFKVAAAAHSNSLNGLNLVTLSGVIFNVTSTNVNIGSGSFLFFNKANSTITKSCVTMTTAGALIRSVASGSFLVFCDALQASSVNTSIDQGKDATFVLQGNILNAKVTSNATSTLQVSLQNFDSLTRVAYGAANSHLDWVDKDTTATRFLWVEYPDTTVKSTSYQS